MSLTSLDCWITGGSSPGGFDDGLCWCYESVSVDDCRGCQHGSPCTTLAAGKQLDDVACYLKGGVQFDVPDGCPVAEARYADGIWPPGI